MEPLSLTVATLLATKAGEAFGSETAKRAWSLLRRLAEAVQRKLSGDPEAEDKLAELEAQPGDDEKVQAVAGTIGAHAGADPAFKEELEALVAEARDDPDLGRFVTTITGNASVGKVTNIGTVHGNVTF